MNAVTIRWVAIPFSKSSMPPYTASAGGYPPTSFKVDMSIVIEEPRELDPVQLIRLVQVRNPDLRYKHFAIALGASQSTLEKWMRGVKRPSKANRILAAKLAQEWGIAG